MLKNTDANTLPLEAISASGDSGGPAVIGGMLAGTNSGSDDRNGCAYGSTDQYCRLSTHYDWIQSVITADLAPAPPAAPPAPIVIDFSCTKANPIATDVKVDISPNPAVPGQDLTITISANLGADLPKMVATVTVDVKVSILPKINIGPLAVPISTTPYVKKGPIQMTVGPIQVPTTKLPVKGTLDLTVDVTDGSGTEVSCFNIKGSI